MTVVWVPGRMEGPPPVLEHHGHYPGVFIWEVDSSQAASALSAPTRILGAPGQHRSLNSGQLGLPSLGQAT